MEDQQAAIKRNLETAIRNAFADVERPPDSEITANIGDYDREDLRKRVANQTWEDLLTKLLNGDEVRDLNYYHSMFRFFEPKAFRYFLPAFMISSLETERSRMLWEHLLPVLTPPYGPEEPHTDREWQSRWFSAFTALLTTNQHEVVRRFILYVESPPGELRYDDRSERTALNKYWNTY